ncbi:MAG: hypothetical protein HZC18_00240 [Candidatus Omnitrophica bacterium]|nr:hypothetical protein [Candidatus Omnitrophota bacterium]
MRFAWPVGSLREETGRRVVEEERDGAMRAAYGKQLIPQLSKALSEKCGPGFSETNLRNPPGTGKRSVGASPAQAPRGSAA